MHALKKLRKAEGLSAKEVGEMVGVSERMIHFIEKGDKVPSLVTLSRFCEAFPTLDPRDFFTHLNDRE